jgi:phosphoribosylaminoimidazole (AIR) synthetase
LPSATEKETKMKMSLKEKKASANQVLDKLAEQFGIVYTEAERNFNVGYLVALIDAAEQNVQWTGGESAASQALSTPEVNLVVGADSTPPTIH